MRQKKKKKRGAKFAIWKGEETDFSYESVKEMFVFRQFDWRKRSHCDSLKALADLLIVADCAETMKRGRGGE